MAAIPPVNPTRIRIITPPGSKPTTAPGPIIYWMFRDQRVADNHALLHALHLSSLYSSPVAVAFTFISPFRFLNARSRQILFMLRGLKTLSLKLRSLNIPFFFFHGNPIDTIPSFVKDCGATVLVTDFTPLRPVREWKEEIVKRIEGIEVHEVDAHNVVPVWVASGKLEYSAKTIRGKIQKLLPEYLVDFPDAGRNDVVWRGRDPPEVDWDELIVEAARSYPILHRTLLGVFSSKTSIGVYPVEEEDRPTRRAVAQRLMKHSSSLRNSGRVGPNKIV